MSSPSENEGIQTTPSAPPDHAVQAEAAHGREPAHEHSHAAAEGPHFSDQEWKEFQDDDIHAGGAVVCLMAGIFSTGLMLYATIAIIVAS